MLPHISLSWVSTIFNKSWTRARLYGCTRIPRPALLSLSLSLSLSPSLSLSNLYWTKLIRPAITYVKVFKGPKGTLDSFDFIIRPGRNNSHNQWASNWAINDLNYKIFFHWWCSEDILPPSKINKTLGYMCDSLSC